MKRRKENVLSSLNWIHLRHLEIEKFIEGAKALYEAGADLIMMADNSLASPRVLATWRWERY